MQVMATQQLPLHQAERLRGCYEQMSFSRWYARTAAPWWASLTKTSNIISLMPYPVLADGDIHANDSLDAIASR